MVLKNVFAGIAAAYIGYALCETFFDTMDPETLKGKNVLLAGASSGIGEQVAYQYARLGANVFITARRENLLQKVVEKCKTLGMKRARFGYISSDMSKEKDAEIFVEAGVKFLGGIDHLILNHAALVEAEHWEGTPNQLARLSSMLDVNMISYVRLTAHALPHLRQSGGAIAAVSSTIGRLPFPYVREYVTTKFAIDGFFSSLRSEFVKRKENVSITVCILGLIDTDASNKVHDSMDNILSPQGAVGSKILKMISATPADTAFAMISATTKRQPELVYPWYQLLKPGIVLRQFFPTLMDILT